ncbi:multicopper oxidase domain-containing protein [Duganella sp. sic0402]|uniref:multicopper oxidase domain-containing protein n=1 Tax=Duganella sp. sic0402 TaxID=2854786 RepID=UPI001C47D5BD|nr:multicopper oxidase domain-containing protein [Duganella sp. sic0402]MBV7536455.1 multicopper oxidase domain-containing protein [Duganella sp. sic0402]
MKKLSMSIAVALALLGSAAVQAKTVKINLTAKEVETAIDNKGTMYRSWTYEGMVPGPVIHVEEGDIVEFTLFNDKSSKNSHSVDFHAARVDVVKDFEQVKPGEQGSYTFRADYPGIFFYHCGADPMIQHIARGMYGAIIVDPKDKSAMPKADREYVLIQSELYANPDNQADMMANKWTNVMFNGGIFKYDPVHDPAATRMLQAKPGERVRVYFVNAGVNEFSSFHAIAGIWDKVYPSGNPKNQLTGLQSYVVGPGDAASFDIISPVEGANALVSHSLRQALSGAIAILQFTKDADPKMGRGENILVR